MSIYVPHADYSSLGSAMQNKANVDQAEFVTKSQELQSKQITQQQKHERIQTVLNIAEIVVDAVDQGVSIAQNFKKVTEAGQLENAKTSVLDTTTQFNKMMLESQLNGGTQVIQNDDGSLAIQMDQSLVDWQQQQLTAINESKDMKSVKAWKAQALQTAFSDGQKNLMENAASISYKAIQDNYSQNLMTAAQSDVKSGSYENGASLISSRTDLSQLQKQTQFAAYKHSVDTGIAEQRISEISASGGLSKATDAAYALEGFSVDEIQSFVATAAKTDSQLTDAAVSTAGNLMQTGLDSGKSPAVLWAQVNNASKNMPEDRKNAAIDAAKKAQVVWSTGKAASLWNGDRNADLSTLKSQRKSIESGSLSISTFQGVPEVKKATLSWYDSRIDELEKAGVTANTKAQADLVKTNNTIADGLFQSLKNGDISGSEAITAVSGLAGNTESYEDDLHSMTLINRIKDEIVPENFKPAATKFISEMEKLNYGIDVGKNGSLTSEQTAQIGQARLWTNQAIANLFMATPASQMSNKQFSDSLATIKQTFIGKNLDILESGAIVDRLNADPVDDLTSKNQAFGDMDNSPILMDTSGQVQWASNDMKKTYDAVAGQFQNELKSQYGINITSAPSPLMIDGNPYPTPIVQGETEGGSKAWFAFDKDEIFTSTDGKNWEQFGSLKTKTKFKTDTKVNQFFDQFRSTQETPEMTARQKRAAEYQAKKAEKDPENKHKTL
jgi:hypothetical protein